MSLNITKDFLKAGKAIFTVANPKGEYYTYRIRRIGEDGPLAAGLLTGPDNRANYTYTGIYNPDHNEVRLTAKSRLTADSVPFKVLTWAVSQVAKGVLPDGYSIHHEGKCGRCGRTLTTPDSLNRGLGPECASKA